MPVLKKLKRIFRRVQKATGLMAILFLGGIYLSVAHPPWIRFFSYLQWLPWFTLSFTLLALLFYQRRSTLSQGWEGLTLFLAWQGRWWAGALCLWGIWVANMLAWVLSSPPGIQAQIPNIESLLLPLWQHYPWGYPWIIYGLLTVAYRLFLDQNPNQPMPESLTEPVFKGRLHTLATLMAGIMVSLGTQLALGLTAITLVLLGLQILDHLMGWPSHLSLGIWLLAFLGFFAGINRFFPWKKCAYWGGRRGIGFWGWTIFLIILLSALLIFFKQWAFARLPDARLYLTVESVVEWKMNQWALPIERLEALMWAWWLLWTPLIASYWARISRGIPLIWVVSMALVLPLLMSFLPFSIIALGLVKQASLHIGILVFLVLLLLIFLGITLWGQNNARRFAQGWLTEPRGKRIKAERLSKVLPFWATLLGNLLLFHSMGGWYLIQLQIVGPAVLLSLCILGVNASLLLKLRVMCNPRVGWHPVK